MLLLAAVRHFRASPGNGASGSAKISIWSVSEERDAPWPIAQTQAVATAAIATLHAQLWSRVGGLPAVLYAPLPTPIRDLVRGSADPGPLTLSINPPLAGSYTSIR